MDERCISLDNRAEWERALEGIPHAFAHTWGNCYSVHLTTGYKTYLYCLESRRTRIVCPIAERPFGQYVDVVTPYGFSGFVGNAHCDAVAERWRAFAERQSYVCGYINLNPLFEQAAYISERERFEHNSVYWLDLTRSESDLFNAMSSNRKRELRNWPHNSQSIILDERVTLEFLLRHYKSFYDRKQASGSYNVTPDTLKFLAQLDNIFIVGAGPMGQVEAVSMFSYTSYAADYWINVSVGEGKRFTTSLLWYSVLQLQAMGVPVLNLGGGIREGDGVAEYKRRFGAQHRRFGCLKQIYRPDVYRLLCSEAGADYTDMSGYFPAYRRPQTAMPGVMNLS